LALLISVDRRLVEKFSLKCFQIVIKHLQVTSNKHSILRSEQCSTEAIEETQQIRPVLGVGEEFIIEDLSVAFSRWGVEERGQ
jgi:hypothetical protein